MKSKNHQLFLFVNSDLFFHNLWENIINEKGMENSE